MWKFIVNRLLLGYRSIYTLVEHTKTWTIFSTPTGAFIEIFSTMLAFFDYTGKSRTPYYFLIKFN